MKNVLFVCHLALGLLAISIAPVHAIEQQQFKNHASYKIFYSAFGSSFLTPEIAVANNIVRGKDRGIVNIAVVETLGMGLPAEVSGVVSNIFQQRQKLIFTEIREQNTVYYLAPFKFDNEDYLTFKIKVTPKAEGAKPVQAYDLKFQKKMYHNWSD